VEEIFLPAGPTNTALDRRAEALARWSLGVGLELRGEEAAALQEMAQAARLDPDQESLVIEAARRLVQAKQPEQAREILSSAAARPSASGPLLAFYGWVCQLAGRANEAVEACQQAIRRSPTHLMGYQTLFNLHLLNQQLAPARDLLEQAARQPGDAVFLIEVAELYAKYRQQAADTGDKTRQEMLSLLDRASALKPDTIGYQLKLADAYNYLGESAKAVELYLELQEKYADLPALRNNIREKLTDLYLRGKDRKKAMAQLEAIIKEHPLNPQAYYYLGGLAFDEKDYPRAAEYLAQTILLNPAFEQGYYDTAAAQINANQPAAALNTLAKARARFPQGFTLEYYSGLAHVRAKDYAAAVKAFTAAEVIAAATSRDKLTPVLFFQIGAAYERLKQYDMAEKYFGKALDLDPNFAEALNYLGYMWADLGINLERAKNLIERALKLEPKNAAFLDSLGWIYYRMGQHQQALEYVTKACELATEPDATLFDHLGDIYLALGQRDQAREQWRKALEIEANEAIKKKLEQTAP